MKYFVYWSDGGPVFEHNEILESFDTEAEVLAYVNGLLKDHWQGMNNSVSIICGREIYAIKKEALQPKVLERLTDLTEGRKVELRELAEVRAQDIAQEIGSCAWYACLHLVMTKEEQEEVTRRMKEGFGDRSWMSHALEMVRRKENGAS